jgi:glycyl-tRNA synthetase beta chain
MPLFDFAAAEVHATASAIAARDGKAFATQRMARDGWADDHYRESFDLLDFFADRLKVHLRDAGTRHDLISAVFALGNEDDLVRLLARVKALEGFLGSDDGANLLIAYRRAANIVRIEEKKDGVTYGEAVEAGLLQQAEERALADALAEVGRQVRLALAGEHFPEAMTALARLRQPVDAFFDKVTVNTEEREVRANRLKLLSHIVATMQTVADFSKIEG